MFAESIETFWGRTSARFPGYFPMLGPEKLPILLDPPAPKLVVGAGVSRRPGSNSGGGTTGMKGVPPPPPSPTTVIVENVGQGGFKNLRSANIFGNHIGAIEGLA